MKNDGLIREMREEYSDYLHDESRTVGLADSISFPRAEEDIRTIMRYCHDRGCPVTVQGGRTGLAAAAVPFGGHILNLSRMDRVTGMALRDGVFYLTVQPGAVLRELRKAIAAKRFDTANWSPSSLEALDAFRAAGEQMFTPDPTETSATIGGMAACNASGARTHGYGPTRGYVEGVRVVLADGDVVAVRRGEVHARGRKMTLKTESGRTISADLPTYTMPRTKNASGYYAADDMDAVDLFVGSDGTLGVLSELELRLLPLPDTIWAATCFFDREDRAIAFVDTLRRAEVNEVSLEYFDRRALDILRIQKKEKTAFAALPDIPADVGAAVYAELHCSSEAEAAGKLFRLGEILTGVGGSEENTWVARTENDRDKLLFFRHAVPESVNMLIDERKKLYPAITKLGSDMSVPDEHIFDVVRLYRTTLAEEGFDTAVWGHIGENHLHVNILPRNEEEYIRGKELFVRWAEAVTAMGGAVSAEHGVGKLKASFLRIMYGDEHIREMAALKRAFDEKSILGIGNLFSEEDGRTKS